MIGLGSSSSLGIGLIIELRDKFTQKANQVSASMNVMHKNADKALKSSFNLMTGVGVAMTVAGVKITRSMISATKESMAFKQVLLNVKALGEMTTAEMDELGRIAQLIGPKYGKDAITVARGMEDLVKAGLKGKDIPKVMEAILQTATAAQEKLEGETGVAARMVDIMMAWGANANQAGRIGDIMAKGAIESTVSFNDLAESMKYSQDILKGLHLTFEESVAMMGVLGNAGIKASMSGTALGNAWREITIALGGTSKKKNKALEMLGLSRGDLMDAHGNLKRPLEILDRIKKGVAGMGDVKRQNVLNDLFGVRGKRGINPLLDFLKKGPNDKWMGKSFQEMVKTLTSDSIGANMKIIEEKSKGAAFQAEQLRANWENFKIAVGNALMPLLNWALPKLISITKALANFANKHPMLVRMIASFGILLITFGGLLTIVGLIGRSMMGLSSGFVAFRTAGLWVWNTLIARALTYFGIMKGIEAGQGINAAGSIFDKRTGRIIKTAFKRGMGGKGLLSWLGKLSPLFARFTGFIARILPSFSSLLPILGNLGRALTGIGIISLVLSTMGISFKNQLLYVLGSIKWVIGSVINAIMGMIEWFGVDLGGGGWSNRQEQIGKASFGGIDNTPDDNRAYSTQDSTGHSFTHARLPAFNPNLKKGDTIVNIHVDGEKTISKKINENNENELSTRYGFSQ